MSCTTTCRPARGKQAHCTVCHRTFGAVSGFDLHRRGGVCVDPATIKGQRQDSEGVWRYPPKDRDADSPWRILRQSAETGEVVPPGTPSDSVPADSLSGGSA